MIDFKDWMAERVAQLQSDEIRYRSSQGLEQIRAELGLFQSAARDVAKVIESLARLDLEGRRVRLAERDAALMSQVIDNTLKRLDLTPAQLAEANGIIVEELLAVDAAEKQTAYRGRSQPAALPRAR